MNDFDITDIENLVSAALRTIGFTHVWNNRPKATDDTISDFVVVKVSGGITDKAAFGQCRLAIYLFARDVKEMKNAKKLSVMQKKTQSLPLWIEPEENDGTGGGLLIDGHPRIVGDTPDDFGFHCRIINYRVTIKTA